MNKIITIRGTSGAGKSHLVRRVMELYKNKQALHVPDRKQPYYYTMKHPTTGGCLSVLGHYETACGGCDTIQDADSVYQLIRERHHVGDVIFEGLLLGCDVKRTAALGVPVHAIYLDTPVDVCVESINIRRRARGQMKPVPEKNTLSKYKSVRTAMKRLKYEAPLVEVFMLNREDAFVKMKELLSL